MEEAPTLSGNDSVETLADFGTVAFSNMSVEGPASATGSPIYMVNNSNHIIAYPTQYNPGTDSFSVIYGTLSSPPVTARPGCRSRPPRPPPVPPLRTSPVPAQLDGQGLWLVARDGGIFAFGTAKFHGSTGNMHLQGQWPGSPHS